MLQIISGKFFDSEDRFHNDCKGILYSNISFSGVEEFDFIKIESVEAYNNISSYVISYDNQLQQQSGGMQLVKVGDDEIIRQLKNILSFSLNGFFDEDKTVVEKMCRTKGTQNRRIPPPSAFIKSTLDTSRLVDKTQIEASKKFFKQMIGLKRNDYVNVLKCLIAYNTSIKVLNEDMNLSYSILVYCLESLSKEYGDYAPNWNDYDQNKKVALENIFSHLPSEDSNAIKDILIKDKHFKLFQKFRDFVISFLDNGYYQHEDGRRVVHKDDTEVALKNAYILRSKYAHELKPINKQLTIDDLSMSNDTFEFMHDTFFTYSGLLKTAKTVICNLVFSLEIVETERFAWANDLPGLFQIQPAAYFWIWKPAPPNGEGAELRLEGLLECLVYYRKNIPQLDHIVKLYFEHLPQMKENNKRAAYTFGCIYGRTIGNLTEDNKNIFNLYIDRYKDLIDKCCIYNLILLVTPVNITREIAWKIEDCENVIEGYNKNKHKRKNIRLPSEIETMIYLMIANGAKEESIDKPKEWMVKAYDNSNNNKAIQDKIMECINSGDEFDISFIWDNIYARFEEKL